MSTVDLESSFRAQENSPMRPEERRLESDTDCPVCLGAVFTYRNRLELGWRHPLSLQHVNPEEEQAAKPEKPDTLF